MIWDILSIVGRAALFVAVGSVCERAMRVAPPVSLDDVLESQESRDLRADEKKQTGAYLALHP